MKPIPIFLSALLCACAHTPPPPAYKSCTSPLPLELRLKRIEGRLEKAYADAPPLTAQEHAEVRRLADCFGGAVLGVGTGCAEERAAARASGLYARNAIRGAQFSLPDHLTRAASQPLGGERTRTLIVAMHIAEQSRDALRAHLLARLTPEQRADLEREIDYVREPAEVRAYRDGVTQLTIVAADIEAALVCDAEDMAAGRKTGLPFDPAAPVPAGP